jgi:hypothetical protein
MTEIPHHIGLTGRHDRHLGSHLEQQQQQQHTNHRRRHNLERARRSTPTNLTNQWRVRTELKKQHHTRVEEITFFQLRRVTCTAWNASDWKGKANGCTLSALPPLRLLGHGENGRGQTLINPIMHTLHVRWAFHRPPSTPWMKPEIL